MECFANEEKGDGADRAELLIFYVWTIGSGMYHGYLRYVQSSSLTLSCERKMSDKADSLFARTDFWLIILVAQMVEYILLDWVYDYSHNREIVDAVSFGGTLLSILVGQIAIGLSLYLAYSQQRDSDTVAREVLRLQQVAELMRSSSEEMGRSLKKLDRVGDKLEEHTPHILSTHEKSDMIHEQVNAVKALLQGSKVWAESAAKGSKPDADNQIPPSNMQSLGVLQEMATFELMYWIYVQKRTPLPADAAFDKLLDLGEEFAPIYLHSDNPISTASSYLQGIFAANATFAYRIGLLEDKNNETWLTSAFERELITRVEAWAQGSVFDNERENATMRSLLPITPTSSVQPAP